MSPTEEKLKSAIDDALAPLIADHTTYIAGGDKYSLPVARADLHYVFNQYGDQLLDFTASVMPVGHKHPFVHQAVREHMDYYMRTGPVGEHVLRWPVEYARDIVDTLTPEDTDPRHQVLFTEGEREAVEVAINMARRVTGKFKVAVVDTGAHSWLHAFHPADGDLVRLQIDEFWLRDFRWEEVGGLLLSLITEDGRVLEPRWVQELADYAKQNGVPIICDESLSGFGRLGKMWGHQHHQFDPEFIVLGGPVGGGLALGAVVTTRERFEGLTWFVSPQAGSPVACAAGASTLKAINPAVIQHVADAGHVFAGALNGLIDQFPEFVVTTYGTGLHHVVEFQSDGQAKAFVHAAADHGLLVNPPVGSSLILTPTLIASELELVRGVDLMADTLLDWQEADSLYR